MPKKRVRGVFGKKEKKLGEALLLANSLSQDDRAEAAAVMGKTRSPAAVEHLKGMLGDPAWSVRLEAVRALAAIDSNSSRGLLLKTLDDSFARVKSEAIQLAASMKMREAVPKLSEIADNSSLPFVRCQAIDALGELGDERAVKTLVRIMKSGNHAPRISAAQALAKIGGTRALKELENGLRDNDSEIRRLSAGLLRGILGARKKKR